MLTTKNIPNYTLVGSDINFQLRILDNLDKGQVKTTVYLDGRKVMTKKFVTNKLHNISLIKRFFFLSS